jgi:hypothetical protein
VNVSVRRVKRWKFVWCLAAAVLATGCGTTGTVAPGVESRSQSRHITDARHGYSFVLPAGWHRARRNLTPDLVEPREILSAATYPLRYDRRARCRISGCPTPALNGFRRTDILMSIQERVRARAATEDVGIDLERRQYGLESNCTRGRVAWFAFEEFKDAGRTLYVLVVMGKRAPASARTDLRRLLDSLRFSRRDRTA